MMGKRFFLIAGGTVGGLGAVLAITPPQFGTASGLVLGTGRSLSGGTTSTPAAPSSPVSTPAASATPTPKEAASATPATPPKATPKPTHKPHSKATPKAPPVSTPSATPTPSSTPKASGVSGTYAGASANTIYGPVQVQITLVGGKITNAVALTYPTASVRDQQINDQAIPFLIKETLIAQPANILGANVGSYIGVTGASYTSQGWYTSLVSALAKAGL